MDAIAVNVIAGLSSLALGEFNLLHDLKDDKKRMEKTVSAIKAVLLDAEANAANDHRVSNWLKELQEVLYDADDLLDDFSAEALAREVMTGSKTAKEVRIFFSKSNQLAYGHKMSREMKEIRKKLEDIAHDMNNLPQIPRSPRATTEERDKRETDSFVREDEVVGRDEEKVGIVSYLLDINANHDLSKIAVVGVGGLGKTCLAQLVYNDQRVQNYFELRMWICVSDRFDEIGQKMAECDPKATSEEVQERLRNKIRGRRFLVVLDDIWNENRELWQNLERLLLEGGKGSKVIITTRSGRVANAASVDKWLNLRGLEGEKSWKLFSRLAFDEGKEPNNPNLVAIAKEICKKCIGVPLAIKTMANLLYSENSDSWLSIRDSELLSRDEENNNILDILRLSYDHLSSNLKRCFAYCSLFPKDFDIEQETLIQLWIAQGFIPLSNRNRSPEYVGHDFFMKLLSRCFFQDVEKDKSGNIRSCKMHDLMHDLARAVSNNECMIISEENKEFIGDSGRHLCMNVPTGLDWKVQNSLLDGKNLRTYFSPEGSIEWEKSSENLGCYGRRGEWSRTVAFIQGKFRKSSLPVPRGLKRLRVLHLPQSVFSIIPKSIGKLKHLRYLDLSWSTEIKKLPRSITKLHNLQTLKLNHCWRLEELPRDINKMVSLRHLELDSCCGLDWMPRGLGQLTSLQTMTQFSLNPTKSDSARLSELGGLNNLKGRLSIYNLQQVRGNAAEAKLERLLYKQHLQHLGLYWQIPKYTNHIEGCFSVAHTQKDRHEDEMVLHALQPHDFIKTLTISGCFIKILPNWVRNLSLLQILCLTDLYLEYLPESIGNLSSLQQLAISTCRGLASFPESVGNLSSLQLLEISLCEDLASLPESTGNLSSLQQLEISSCPHMASLPESTGNLSSLQRLEICDCPGLASLPESIGNLSSLQRLEIVNCSGLASLPESIGNLSSLQRLEIVNCSGLASLPESIGNLSSLQRLEIVNCSGLASLPESIGNLSSLQRLEILNCSGLASLPESIGNLSSLQWLQIFNCLCQSP